MPMPALRARIAACAALLALAAGLSGPAAQAAEDYPRRPISLIVPFPPGGGTDISARLLATKLGSLTQGSVVVDNRPGAAGQIAADAVARARPDGYTLLFANSGMMAINPWLYTLQTDPAAAFEPVSLFSDLPFALVVSDRVPANTVQELVALAKQKPGHYTYASSGTGGAPHMAGELFQQATGTQLLHVPYKGGGQALADLVAGHVDMLFASVLETVSYVRAGQLRALAVTGAERSPALPDVPTLAQAGVADAQIGSWTAVLAPKGTPEPVVRRLAELIAQAASAPDVQETLVVQGAAARHSSPQELAQLAAQDRERFGRLIQERQIKTQ
ncbi:tripartite tricarboxylate transporter substrate binding protein [Orrella sp. JC864]|uniref:Bug family tripartite tricarboxylate transporter substrate binding protein n=1 Tax=Orrella sp. JC864 TaxID=3120298 RepID=UPI0030086C24